MTEHDDDRPDDDQPDDDRPEALGEAYGKLVGRVEVGKGLQEQQRRIAEKFAGLLPKVNVLDAKLNSSIGPLNPPARSAYDVLRDMPEIEVVPSASAENQHRQNELLEEVLDLTRRSVELAEADRATSEQLNASTKRMVAAQESASGLTWKVFWATTAVAVLIAVVTVLITAAVSG